MTQKEAIIEALQTLGGRAHLQEIYPLAISTGLFAGSANPQATIRNCLLTSPGHFHRSDGKPSGWWELVSFQEEMALRDRRIAELEAEVERLRRIPTEDEFVRRLVRAAKNLYKHENVKTDVVRQLLYKLGRYDDERELDNWITEREQLQHSAPHIELLERAEVRVMSSGNVIANTVEYGRR